MNTIQFLAAQPWVDRLGSTLLHFLWQGALVTAVYAVARRLTTRSSPNVRYVFGCTALALMAASVGFTWVLLGSTPTEQIVATLAISKPAIAPPEAHAIRGSFTAPLPAVISPQYLTWVVAAWFAGVIALCLRLIASWISAEHLRTRKVRLAPVEWQQTLDRLKQRIRISRPVRLLVSARVNTPMVVGWLRPVVLTPIGALAGLPPEQMEALLLHELAHIRRHDYLVNMLQSIVEALLFYHPAVWWISAHIRAERELCCDDIAVSINGDALTYVRALLELASPRLAHPSAAMAATGGSLADRIARLLGQTRSTRRTRSGPGITATVILALAGLAIFAQPTAQPKFEVSSIKPATNHGMRWVRPAPGRLTAEAPLQLLILNAYAKQPFQVVGGPSWIESDWYDVEAKASSNPSRAELFLMLQSLLEDRFHLTLHRETKDLPVYYLQAAKNGLKLTSPKDGACVEPLPDAPNEWAGGRMQPPMPGVATPPPLCGRLRFTLDPAGARLQGGKVNMPELVRSLSMALGRSVIDKTGFTGLFDVDVSFVADQTTPTLPPPPPDQAAEFTGPSLMPALQDRLGLRLESGKGPVDVLVIDHVERPTAN
jgi:uncharacterized protein (TIGR03435 family)